MAALCAIVGVVALLTLFAVPSAEGHKAEVRVVAASPVPSNDVVITYYWTPSSYRPDYLTILRSGLVRLGNWPQRNHPVGRISRRRVQALLRARAAASGARVSAKLCGLGIQYDGASINQGLLWKESACTETHVITVAFGHCPPESPYPQEDPVDCRVGVPATIHRFLRLARAATRSVLGCRHLPPGCGNPFADNNNAYSQPRDSAP